MRYKVWTAGCIFVVEIGVVVNPIRDTKFFWESAVGGEERGVSTVEKRRRIRLCK
jgi:hypothetical protein